MPTVICLDVSLSMLRPIPCTPNSNYHSLALHGIHCLLDHFEHYFKLEYVALLTFSSLYEKISGFSRDFAGIRGKLGNIVHEDVAVISSALTGLQTLVYEEWGNSVPINVLLFTDGLIGYGPNSLRSLLLSDSNKFPRMSFQGSFHVIILENASSSSSLHDSKFLYTKLLQNLSLEGSVLDTQTSLSPSSSSSSSSNNISKSSSVESSVKDLISRLYKPYTGTLIFGSNNTCSIGIYPPPISSLPLNSTSTFESSTISLSERVEIMGFLTLAELASPPVYSRHLVLPLHEGSSEDVRTTPSLVVFLHGALKVENLAALVTVAENWFGILFSCADSKKKSALMLSLFYPGSTPVPWLGNLNELGPRSELNTTNSDPFPVLRKGVNKPSYSSNPVVWIKASSLQSDIQKILRHARKLPDKTPHFYKELNRVKRAALTLGFHELLEGLAFIFDKESSVLPGSSHPDCSSQLAHASASLRSRDVYNIDFNISPLNTKSLK